MGVTSRFEFTLGGSLNFWIRFRRVLNSFRNAHTSAFGTASAELKFEFRSLGNDISFSGDFHCNGINKLEAKLYKVKRVQNKFK